MFVVYNDLPYYINGEANKMYPCTISAFGYVVNFAKPMGVPARVDSIMTDSEIRKRFNIRVVDGWDKAKDRPKRVSNKTVSSDSVTR